MSTDAGAASQVVVVGGGVAGLAAALELARHGLRPVVLEAADACGGVLSAHRLGGLTLDAGAESFATGRPAVTELLSELNLLGRVTLPNPVGAWVRHRGGAAPLPATGFLGIPGRPWAADVRRVIGTPGALRCTWDAVLPTRSGLPPGANLGGLVRTRMGGRVLERLVEPVAGGVYAADPGSLEIQTVAPSLPQAMIDAGSLAGAARLLRSGGERAGSAVATLTDGLHSMVPALVDAVRAAGGVVRTGSPVQGLTSDVDGWRVAVPGSAGFRAGTVVVALPAPQADRLLSQAVSEAHRSVLQVPISQISIVTLVVEDHRLDAAPRGTGVLVSGRVTAVHAKALTHSTAKWRWLADLAGPGRHVLRLSYGRGNGSDVPADDELAAVALADAADLLGVALTSNSVVDQDVVRWPSALPAPRPGHAAAVQALRAELARTDLAVVGAAVAGSGLAAVIGDARREADRVLTHLDRASGIAASSAPAHPDPVGP